MVYIIGRNNWKKNGDGEKIFGEIICEGTVSEKNMKKTRKKVNKQARKKPKK